MFETKAGVKSGLGTLLLDGACGFGGPGRESSKTFMMRVV